MILWNPSKEKRNPVIAIAIAIVREAKINGDNFDIIFWIVYVVSGAITVATNTTTTIIIMIDFNHSTP